MMLTAPAPRHDCTHECHECDLADPATCLDFAYMTQEPMRWRRVYIAGPLSAIACDYIANLHRFMEVDVLLRRHGFAPYNPAQDVLAGMVAGDLTYDDYFEPNIAWMEVSEAVYLIGPSPGADRECLRAAELGIPVFDNLSALLAWRQ